MSVLAPYRVPFWLDLLSQECKTRVQGAIVSRRSAIHTATIQWLVGLPYTIPKYLHWTPIGWSRQRPLQWALQLGDLQSMSRRSPQALLGRFRTATEVSQQVRHAEVFRVFFSVQRCAVAVAVDLLRIWILLTCRGPSNRGREREGEELDKACRLLGFGFRDAATCLV